jgi:hypothetical protein
MTYTSHGLMTPADWAEYRQDYDWDELAQPEPDDEIVCWFESKPGSGVHCGLSVDHDGDHHFNSWEA